MAASKSTAPVAVLQQQEQEQEQQQHPMPYARRKRFVEQEASIYEIMTWGSAAAPSSPARPAEPSSVHGMKTRSQAAAQQEAATAAAATAMALLKKKLQREATAAKLKASSIALAPVAAAPIQSPWATKTLQPARGGAGRKQKEAGIAVVAPGAGPAVVVTNAHRSSKALFPYPHTPGKAKAVVAAAAAAAEEQAAVQGKTRQLSDTAFAKKYQKPVFLGASPAKSPVATGGQQQQESVQSVQQPRVRQVWPKAAAAAATGAAGSAPVVAMGRTPVKGTKTPGTAKGGKGTATATGGKKSSRGKSGGGRKQPQPPMQVEEAASVLASVEAGYRDFVAALEREREAFQQQTRRTTRSSSGAGGNVVVLASTPAGKARRGSKTPPAAAAVGTEGTMGEFVVVEHADAPAAEVAKALAAAAAAVAAVGNGNEASLSLDDTADTATVVGRSEGAEAALTVLKSKAARRKKGKKAYDEEDEASDSEGEALKTDPRAYRKWVERIPVAGTRVVKGLSVADCFEG